MTILLIILILLLVGAFPAWPYSRNCGYYPSGGLGLIVLLLVICCRCMWFNRAQRDKVGIWSGRRGSNPQPTAWEAATLPLSYSRMVSFSMPE